MFDDREYDQVHEHQTPVGHTWIFFNPTAVVNCCLRVIPILLIHLRGILLRWNWKHLLNNITSRMLFKSRSSRQFNRGSNSNSTGCRRPPQQASRTPQLSSAAQTHHSVGILVGAVYFFNKYETIDSFTSETNVACNASQRNSNHSTPNTGPEHKALQAIFGWSLSSYST